MFHQFVLLVSLSVLGQSLATPSNIVKRNFIIGNLFYTVDVTAYRNRAQAVALCESKGGELAKMNGKVLYNIFLATTTTIGGYWIDGIDTVTTERFAESTDCTSDKLKFTDIAADKLDFAPLSCLIFNKGYNPATTKLQAVSCTSAQRGVICATPMGDCKPPVVGP